MIDLLLRLYRLKEEERAGWTLRGVERPESVADHSWGTALLCLLEGPAAGVDVSRAVEMSLIHDLPEAVTGDHPTRPAGERAALLAREKAQRERRAMSELFPAGSDGRIRELWIEYEERTTKEALFVRDMNLIDMCLEAFIYERDSLSGAPGTGRAPRGAGSLEEFLSSSETRLSTPSGMSLFRAVLDRYRRLGT